MMRMLSLASAGLPILVMAACATAPVRAPVTFAPTGSYVQVQPAPGEYTAVAMNQGAYTMRVGNQLWEGDHWVDDQGNYYRVDRTGPCAGQTSVWTYDVRGDRVTLNLVSDACPTRNFSSTYVFERSRR